MIVIHEQPNVNYQLCKECGGHCCKKYPGTYLPSDFEQELTVEYVYQLVNSGKYNLERAEFRRYEYVYFIRPFMTNEEKFEKPQFRGQCINWNNNIGCSLEYKDRPYQCKMLIPQKDNKGNFPCKYEVDIQNILIDAWLPYTSILKEVFDEYFNIYK